MNEQCELCGNDAVAVLADDRALGTLSMKLCRPHLLEAANAPGISEAGREEILRLASSQRKGLS